MWYHGLKLVPNSGVLHVNEVSTFGKRVTILDLDLGFACFINHSK